MSKQKPIRVIKYNPNTQQATEEIINTFEDYYNLIDCQIFTTDSSNNRFDVFVDDEGLMISGNLITEIEGSSAPLAGILIFTGKVDNIGFTLALDKNINTAHIENICKTKWEVS